MNMTLLQTVAEAVGLDASQGAILHRSHRGYWEIHGRFTKTSGHTATWVVSCLPWEARPSRLPDDTNTGIEYIPALKGVEDPDRALEIIAAHMGVGVAGSVNTINLDRVALWKAKVTYTVHPTTVGKLSSSRSNQQDSKWKHDSAGVVDADDMESLRLLILSGGGESLFSTVDQNAADTSQVGRRTPVPPGYMCDKKHVFPEGSTYSLGQSYCPSCDCWKYVYSPEGEKQFPT